MSNDYIAPIDHSGASALATEVGGGARGALKGGAKGALTGWGLITVIGAGIGLVAGLLLFTHVIAISAVTTAISSVINGAHLLKFLGVAGFTVAGGVAAAGLLGPAFALIGGLFGGTVGAAKGAGRAANQVSQERGQAAELQAQIEMVRAQQPAPTIVYTQPPATGFPPYGSPMNQANPNGLQVGNDNMQYQGLVSNPQLAQAL